MNNLIVESEYRLYNAQTIGFDKRAIHNSISITNYAKLSHKIQKKLHKEDAQQKPSITIGQKIIKSSDRETKAKCPKL